jgi:hypothetical protein
VKWTKKEIHMLERMAKNPGFGSFFSLSNPGRKKYGVTNWELF